MARLEILFVFFAFTLFCVPAWSQNIEVKISGMRVNKGQIIVKVFKDDESFSDDKPYQIKKFSKTSVLNGEMLVKFSLDPGTYGLALVDDENSDGEMEYSFFGMPEEGFGFSNFELKGLYRPSFDQFKFTVNTQVKQKVNMKVKYF